MFLESFKERMLGHRSRRLKLCHFGKDLHLSQRGSQHTSYCLRHRELHRPGSFVNQKLDLYILWHLSDR